MHVYLCNSTINNKVTTKFSQCNFISMKGTSRCTHDYIVILCILFNFKALRAHSEPLLSRPYEQPMYRENYLRRRDIHVEPKIYHLETPAYSRSPPPRWRTSTATVLQPAVPQPGSSAGHNPQTTSLPSRSGRLIAPRLRTSIPSNGKRRYMAILTRKYPPKAVLKLSQQPQPQKRQAPHPSPARQQKQLTTQPAAAPEYSSRRGAAEAQVRGHLKSW